MSEPYVHGHHESVLRSHRWRTAANSAAYLLPHLGPGLDLLDVGCGPGTLTADLARAVAPGRVAAIDAADDVLELAKAATEGLGVEFHQGSVYDLPFPDGSFDVAHAHQVLQHLTDPVGALREMARVTRPGGKVAVRDADYGAMTWWPRPPGLDAWMTLYQTLARQAGGEPNGGRRVLSWVNAAAIGEPRASGSSWVFADHDDRTWWGGLWAERVTASELANRALREGLATPIDLEAMAEGWREWVASPDGWFAVVNGEVVVEVR